MLAEREGAVLVVVDIQPSFLKPIDGAERVLARSSFLIEMAKLLKVPILATEQYPSRMGGTDERLLPMLQSTEIMPKMSFSCTGAPGFMELLMKLTPKQVVLIGIETHICVNQTAHHLLARDVPVFVAADAVGARKADMHQIGIERMRDAGAVIAHSESLVYEWMGTAEDPSFREALSVVKRYSS